MRKLFVVILSIIILLSLTTCFGIDSQELEYSGQEHMEDITAIISKINYNDNKFIEKARGKFNKNYNWVIYKIWESSIEE